MKCTTGTLHPCGQCLACRINARRVWTGRLMLESQCHEHSFFSTFTYKEAPSDGSLHKAHISSTFHTLRKLAAKADRRVRFFAVGEYGEQGGRPHYHAAVFGLSSGDGQLITDAWSQLRDPDHSSTPGFVHHGSLTPQSASYVAGYVTKKLTNKNDPVVAARLGGKEPEFAVMSRRPGIGMLAFDAFVEALNSSAGAMYMARNGDVPVAFMVGGRLLPLGRTIRDHLRLFFFGETGQPKEAKEINERKFFAENLPFVPPDASPTLRKMAMAHFSQETSQTRKKHFETLKQRGRQAAARHLISKSKRTL